MSVFRFSLEAVHRLREETEKDRARDLASALTEAGSAEEVVERLESMEADAKERMSAMGGDVGRQQAMSALLQHVREHRAHADRVHQEAQLEVREAQAELVEAMTERRALEKLKERRYRDWKLETQRRDQKTQDEVNISRSARAKLQGGDDASAEAPVGGDRS